MNSQENTNLKRKAANLSVFSNLLLAMLKLSVGILGSSLSILSEAVHSGSDLLAALIARYAIVAGNKPPDDDHKFGHGKLENFGSFLEAALIIIFAVIIIYTSIKRITTGVEIEYVGWGIILMIFSATVNFFVAKKVKKVSEVTDSSALEADAFHIITDVYTSVSVVLGLLIIYIGNKLGYDTKIVDPLMALVASVYILYVAFGLTKKAVKILMDTKLSDSEEKKIVSIVERYYGEILNFHALRTRKSGSTRHIDLHIVVSKDRHVHEAHDLCDKMETEIKREMPGSDVVIHVEPCDENCEDCEYYDLQCKKD